MKENQLYNVPYLLHRRKSLRNNATSAEQVLWYELKGKQLMGRKFRRQHGIGNYIVDFFCPSEKLIIEVDGKIHNIPDQIVRDKIRTQFLEEQGLRVLRIDNESVFCDIRKVLELIKAEFLSPPPTEKISASYTLP